MARVAFPVDAAAGGAAETFTAVGASAGAGAGAFSVAACLVDAAPWGAAEVAAAKGGVAEGDAGAEAVAASLVTELGLGRSFGVVTLIRRGAGVRRRSAKSRSHIQTALVVVTLLRLEAGGLAPAPNHNT